MPKVFAYGAIMDHAVADEHGRRAFVRDHAVTFTVRGMPLFEPRFAGLQPATGETAWGVLIEMDDAHWTRCLRAEVSYDVSTVSAVCDAGDFHDAYAFAVRDTWAAPEAPPSARYAERLWRGAERHGLPEHVVERYRELRDRGSQISRRFGPLIPIVAAAIRVFRLRR